MTASDERHALRELAEQSGWRRAEVDRVDIYLRGVVRVRVIWRGGDAISGGSLYQNDNLTSYSRELATVTGWLKR